MRFARRASQTNDLSKIVTEIFTTFVMQSLVSAYLTNVTDERSKQTITVNMM